MFIHKVDGLSDDQRAEALKDINFKVNDELSEAGIQINLKTQLTSVYDYSIFEALSIVGQKLIPEVRFYVGVADLVFSNVQILTRFLFEELKVQFQERHF